MNTTLDQQDNHRFGESDYYDANDWAVGATPTVKCLSFIGRREYTTRDGSVKKSAYYSVDDRGMPKDFRLGIKNERILAKKFKFTGYQELVGKEIKTEVVKYPLGNGFVITGVK